MMFYREIEICVFVLVIKYSASSVCPTDISQWKGAASAKGCTAPTEYHCLSDENGGKEEVCLEKSWVQPGFCPEYNTVAKKMDVSLCQESRGVCPKVTYWSSDVYKYSACLPKPTGTTVSGVSSRFPGNQSTAMTYTVLSTPTSKENLKEERGNNGPIISVAVILSIGGAVAMVLIVGYVVRRHKRNREEPRGEDEGDNPTAEPLMSDIEMKGKPQKEVSAPVAIQISETKKVSIDGDFDYSKKYINTAEASKMAQTLFKEHGIIVLVSDNKKALSDVANKLSLTCDTSEDAEGFKEFKERFINRAQSADRRKPKCVVFNGCFKDERGDLVRLKPLFEVFDWMYETQQKNKKQLFYVITVPKILWNARNLTLKKSTLFSDDHLFKFEIKQENVQEKAKT